MDFKQTEFEPFRRHNPCTWLSNWWWIERQAALRFEYLHSDALQALWKLRREVYHQFDQMLVDIAQTKAEAQGKRLIRLTSRTFHG